MANVTAFLPRELLWSLDRGHDYGPYVQYLCMLMREQDLLLTQFSVVALSKTSAWPRPWEKSLRFVDSILGPNEHNRHQRFFVVEYHCRT